MDNDDSCKEECLCFTCKLTAIMKEADCDVNVSESATSFYKTNRNLIYVDQTFGFLSGETSPRIVHLKLNFEIVLANSFIKRSSVEEIIAELKERAANIAEALQDGGN